MFGQVLPWLETGESPDEEEVDYLFRGVVKDALLEEFEGDAEWRQMVGLVVFACL